MRSILFLLESLYELSFNKAMARLFWGPFVFFMALLGALVFVCRVFNDEVCNQPDYYVTADKIRIYNPPSWIDSSFVYEALRLLPAEYRDENQKSTANHENERDPRNPESNEDETVNNLYASPDDLSLFESEKLKIRLNSNDPLLVENLRVAFQKHPLVESVKSIEIRYPAIVEVRLVFRVPTAVVDPSPTLFQGFLNDLSADFPDDYGVYLEQEKTRRANHPETAQNENSETANTGGRFLIDRTGVRLPTPHFRRRPGSYETLPIVVGLNTSSASANSDQLLKESSFIARFFQEVDPESNLQIVKFEVLRVYNSEHGIWFFKTRAGAMVKWGRFVGKARDASDSATSRRSSQRQHDEWEELKAFQKRKLTRLLDLVNENNYAVEKAKLSSDKETRDNAEKLRIRIYDVSSELLGEEEERE